MADKFDAEGVAGEVPLHLDKEVHGLGQALLVAEAVVLRYDGPDHRSERSVARGWSRGRLGHGGGLSVGAGGLLALGHPQITGTAVCGDTETSLATAKHCRILLSNCNSFLVKLTDAGGYVGAGLQVLHVLDGHLDYLRLLDAAAALLQVLGGDEPGQVRQAVVHPITAPLLDDPVRHRVLEKTQRSESYRRAWLAWLAWLAWRSGINAHIVTIRAQKIMDTLQHRHHACAQKAQGIQV